MSVRVAINGFGRIGRCFLRAAWHDPEVDIVAVNDLGDVQNLAYLLKYDSVYGKFAGQVDVEGDELVIGAKRVKFLSERDPAKLPWKDLGVDIVVECTGLFVEFEKAKVHLGAGAKRVVISAPAHGEDTTGASPLGATVLMGINEGRMASCPITSNASCTTNAVAPIIQILSEGLGVELALLNTTHSYTASQRIVDGPSGKPARPGDSGHSGGDFREGRAGAHNMIPSSTGAAVAVTKAIIALRDKFDGIAVRVPTIAGSIADITFIAARPTSAEEVNRLLEAAAISERWRGIFTVSREPLVSSDIIGEPYGSIADLALTRVVGGKLVKVMCWYDNEMGYTSTLLRHVKAAASHLAI